MIEKYRRNVNLEMARKNYASLSGWLLQCQQINNVQCQIQFINSIYRRRRQVIRLVIILIILSLFDMVYACIAVVVVLNLDYGNKVFVTHPNKDFGKASQHHDTKK